MTLAATVQRCAYTTGYAPFPRFFPTAGTPTMRKAAAAALHRCRKRYSLADADTYSWHLLCLMARSEARLAWREACRTSEER